MDVEIPAEIPRTGDDLCTPEVVLKALWRFGIIALDPCSNPWSQVKAIASLSKHAGQDGLTADWAEIVNDRMRSLDNGGFVFANPPYGRGQMLPWIGKVRDEADKGVEIVTLVKHDVSTEWWRLAFRGADAICEWNGRIGFEGGERSAGTFASALLYYGPRPFLFCHVFAQHGYVRAFERRQWGPAQNASEARKVVEMLRGAR
jgi:hypothetical protein